MGDRHITTYLNDHQAGASAAVDLMQHLEKSYANTPVGGLIAGVRIDVEADSRELEALAASLDVTESGPRKAAAWFTERAAEVKMRLEDPSGGSLYLLEALEALGLGIDGKLALWRGLQAAAAEVPKLQNVDFERLAQRAQDQRGRIESARLDAARAVFGAAS